MPADPRGRMLRTCVWAVLAMAACAAPASAVETPSDGWRERMNRTFETRPTVRVSGTFGRAEVTGARAEPLGLRTGSLKLLHAGGAMPVFVENDPRTLAWEGLERLEVPTRATGYGALVGGLAGAATAVLLSATHDFPDAGSAWQPVALIGGGALAGGFVGAQRQRWHVWYPPVDDGVPVHPVSERE